MLYDDVYVTGGDNIVIKFNFITMVFLQDHHWIGKITTIVIIHTNLKSFILSTCPCMHNVLFSISSSSPFPPLNH